MFEIALDPVSNKAHWQQAIELRDEETDELIPLANADIVVEICARTSQDDYGHTSGVVVLSGDIDDGTVTVTGDGVFEFSFTPAQVGALCPKLHDVYCRLTQADITTQLFIGTVPVVIGGSA